MRALHHPHVSIIIPAYNEEKHLEECLLTLKNQTYKNSEIIVIDDTSIDTTKVIAKKYADQVIVQRKQQGAGANRNNGAKRAKGNILVFLDADMYFDTRFIEKLIAPIDHKKAYATFTNDEYLANKNNIWVRCGNIDNGIPQGKRYFKIKTSLTVRAIERKLFMKLGGMKTELGYRDDYIFLDTAYRAIPAKGATCYHYNPETLGEVFEQAQWIGKNPLLSNDLFNLIRYSFINSLVISFKKIIHGAPLAFFVYKITFDAGILYGIVTARYKGSYKK